MSDENRADIDSAHRLDWQSLFALLGRAHTKDLLYQIGVKSDPPVRFSELQESLNLSANTLSRRLAELEETGFLERRSYDEIPPRVEYEPTEQLYDLEPAFTELEAWLEEYGAAELYEDTPD